MKRINRLGRGSDLAALLRRGQRIHAPLFQLAIRRSGLAYPRFVLVVGRAVDKRAVVRNRLRRRAAEYIRTHPALVPAGRDLAVMIKKDAAAVRRKDFYDALRHILSRVR